MQQSATCAICFLVNACMLNILNVVYNNMKNGHDHDGHIMYRVFFLFVFCCKMPTFSLYQCCITRQSVAVQREGGIPVGNKMLHPYQNL